MRRLMRSDARVRETGKQDAHEPVYVLVLKRGRKRATRTTRSLKPEISTGRQTLFPAHAG
jgi:hypothetical protein